MKRTVACFAVSASFLVGCQSAVSPHARMAMNFERHGADAVAEFRPGQVYEPPRVLDLSAVKPMEQIAPKIVGQRVIYVGESHDRLDHHLNQLEIVRRAYEANKNLAIGMEFFQQPFQFALDDYTAGRIEEKEFLKKSEYYLRWRIDYRNYRPILQFARDNRIPVLALDVAEEVRRKIARGETESLTEAEKAQIPAEIDRSNTGYREMLAQIFAMHPDSSDLDRFVEVQLTRDEAMAQTAAAWMQANPNGTLVVLAGGGHLIYGYGVPSRVKRRTGVDGVIVMNDSMKQYDENVADFLLMPNPLRLPQEARIGVILDSSKPGQLWVTGFSEASPAAKAGVEAGDRLLSVDGQDVESMADLKIALLDKNPGDKLPLRVQRKGWFGSEKELGFEVTLY
jgi:uncharacterized iron-regulated protein